MTAQLLASELANLIQESKRKHNDLRQVRGALRTVCSGGPLHHGTLQHCALQNTHCMFRWTDNIGRQPKSPSMS